MASVQFFVSCAPLSWTPAALTAALPPDSTVHLVTHSASMTHQLHHALCVPVLCPPPPEKSRSVVNTTLDGAGLTAALRAHADDGDHVHVSAPMTAPISRHVLFFPTPHSGWTADDTLRHLAGELRVFAAAQSPTEASFALAGPAARVSVALTTLTADFEAQAFAARIEVEVPPLLPLREELAEVASAFRHFHGVELAAESTTGLKMVVAARRAGQAPTGHANVVEANLRAWWHHIRAKYRPWRSSKEHGVAMALKLTHEQAFAMLRTRPSAHFPGSPACAGAARSSTTAAFSAAGSPPASATTPRG